MRSSTVLQFCRNNAWRDNQIGDQLGDRWGNGASQDEHELLQHMGEDEYQEV